MMSNKPGAALRALVSAAIVAALAGCAAGNDDLHAYIDEVKARPGGRIAPLPQVRPAPTFAYEAGGRRSPFMPDVPQARLSNNPNAVQGPDPNRPREFLERFSLDTLRMVGTLQQRGSRFGLVQDSDGLIHRVTVGNHLGQNFGRIMSITDNQIALVEIVPDGLGGYLERPAAVALRD
jgi:type IV pilus assembly protein PilP